MTDNFKKGFKAFDINSLLKNNEKVTDQNKPSVIIMTEEDLKDYLSYQGCSAEEIETIVTNLLNVEEEQKIKEEEEPIKDAEILFTIVDDLRALLKISTEDFLQVFQEFYGEEKCQQQLVSISELVTEYSRHSSYYEANLNFYKNIAINAKSNARITFAYENYEGKLSQRTCFPLGISFQTLQYYGVDAYHFLHCYDYDKKAIRSFRIARINIKKYHS